MKKGFWIIVAISLAGGVLVGVLLLRSSGQEKTYRADEQSEGTVVLGGNILSVSVADTPLLREQGLSGHAPLEDFEGMLFLFDVPGRYSFWMKDMLFPIDIIWISKDWRVVDITPNLSPDTYPNAFSPSSEAQYVLEVRAGYAKAHGVEIGQLVTFRK